MPFLIAKVNIPINSEQEIKLKSRLGKAIELIPGLSEKYLLTGFESDCHFYLRGKNDEAIAYVEVSIFGNEEHLGYEDFSAAITKIFVEVLNIPPMNIYVKFNDIAARSVGGVFFDRR